MGNEIDQMVEQVNDLVSPLIEGALITFTIIAIASIIITVICKKRK